MKYLSQFCIILGFTMAGEALQRLLPLPIPGSVWGLALLFLALCLGIVKTEQVKDVASFLISVMPLMFVAPAVGIVENWSLESSSGSMARSSLYSAFRLTASVLVTLVLSALITTSSPVFAQSSCSIDDMLTSVLLLDTVLTSYQVSSIM